MCNVSRLERGLGQGRGPKKKLPKSCQKGGKGGQSMDSEAVGRTS